MGPGTREPGWVLGIAGGTCSGKTTVVRELQQIDPQLAVVSLDAFYRDRCEFPRVNGLVDMDAPACFRVEELAGCLAALRAGRDVEFDAYDMVVGRSTRRQVIPAAPRLVVEGILVLRLEAIRRQLDLGVFLEVPEPELRRRRAERPGRFFDPEHYDRLVAPAYRDRVWPSRARADVVLDGTRPPAELAREISRRCGTSPPGDSPGATPPSAPSSGPGAPATSP
jgi:uridine kinase